MKARLLGCALLLALAACATHLPRCGSRLTPINHPATPDAISSGRRAAAPITKAAHS